MTAAATTGLAQLVEQMDREVAALVEAGKCGCNCGHDLPAGRKKGTRFIDHSHAQRVYDRRRKASCLAVGQPCRVNLQLALAANGTHTRQPDAKNGASGAHRTVPKPSGMQVPYRKAIDVLVEQLAGTRIPRTPALARPVIEQALRAALPARQRELLDAGRKDLGEAA